MTSIRRIKVASPNAGEPERLTEDLEEVFWQIIFGLMDKHGWSQVEASRHTGLPQSTISRAKRKAQGITLSGLTTVCGRLDISVVDFWRLYEGLGTEKAANDPLVAELKSRSRMISAQELADLLDLVEALKKRNIWNQTLPLLQAVGSKLL